MCHHTLEPTVLSRVSCRPCHLNFDRFYQPCLLPWRNPLMPPKHDWLLGREIGEDCRPRTTWRPLTLAGSPVLPPLRLTGGSATPTGRYHGRTLIHPSPLRVPPNRTQVFAHTQVRDPRESAAACCEHAWGPHPPGHPFYKLWNSEMFSFLYN